MVIVILRRNTGRDPILEVAEMHRAGLSLYLTKPQKIQQVEGYKTEFLVLLELLGYTAVVYKEFLNFHPRTMSFQLVVLFLGLLVSERLVLGNYEDAPGVAMDYKVHIDPGKEDCYYQVGWFLFIRSRWVPLGFLGLIIEIIFILVGPSKFDAICGVPSFARW